MNDSNKDQEPIQDNAEQKTRPNKSRIKREMDALKEQVHFICQLKPTQIEALPLDEQSLNAIAEYKRLKKPNAQKRQLQFITRLISTSSQLDELLETVRLLQNPHLIQQQKDRQLDLLFQDLMTGNQEAIDKLLSREDIDDRQHVMQLIRNASNEHIQALDSTSKNPKQKKLKQFLKSIL